ncbi:hypothetical protein [Agrobacterium sp. Azo12]|uniref:hypothetical protein n=1 Tax=Agrobacterium sp. Azo12 TaxID=3031129 RepID=UPI0023D7B887|nr:hypothetical protein [Agrobacterium sp. Azo12]MDO5895984.1 hypothetical protein [Agrobacterium sp. Azo12]
MEYKIATASDLAKVFRRNDERMTTEYVAAGFNPRKIKELFNASIKVGQAHTLTEKGEPLAVIAWQLNSQGIATTFAGRPEFFNPSFVRFCRRHIRHIQIDNKNIPVVACSYGTHEQLQRWFELLGFTKQRKFGAATVYYLQPKHAGDL